MATWYVYDSGDNDPGYGPTDREDPSQADNWSNAYQDLSTALAAASAGDRICVAADHAETEDASVTFTSPGTLASPVTIIAIDRSTGAYSSNKAGSVNFDSGDGNYDITLAGVAVVWGLYFSADDEIYCPTSEDQSWLFYSCRLDCDVSSSGYLSLETNDNEPGRRLFHNCAIGLGSGYFEAGNEVTSAEFQFCTITGSGGDSTLFKGTSAGTLDVLMYGCDLSGWTTEQALFEMSAFYNAKITLSKCKLPSGYTLVDADPDSPTKRIECFDCDDGNTIYAVDCYYFEGHVVTATNCYRSATYDGSNGYSVKIVTSAYAVEKWHPLRYKLCELWCSSNPTISVELINAGTTFQDDEVWVEIVYPDSTTGCLGKLKSSQASDPLSPSNLTTSSETWTEDLGSEVKQKISQTVSGGQAGVHQVWICVSKPSTTLYVDPHVDVS